MNKLLTKNFSIDKPLNAMMKFHSEIKKLNLLKMLSLKPLTPLNHAMDKKIEQLPIEKMPKLHYLTLELPSEPLTETKSKTIILSKPPSLPPTWLSIHSQNVIDF